MNIEQFQLKFEQRARKLQNKVKQGKMNRIERDVKQKRVVIVNQDKRSWLYTDKE